MSMSPRRPRELEVARDVTGIYNIAEEDGEVSSERARRLLGWGAG